MSIFTISEKKWILETIKYDIYTTSYAVLKENGLPVSNMDINISNENLLRNYFSNNFIKEDGDIILFKIFKDFKNSINNIKDNSTTSVDELLNKEVQEISKKAIEESKEELKDMIEHVNKEVRKGVAESHYGSFFGKIVYYIYEIKISIINKLVNLGINHELASIIAPTIMIFGSLATIYLMIKLIKFIISSIKKLNEESENNKEFVEKEAITLASISLKMQKQALSKIKDENLKNKVQKKLIMKEKILKKYI